MGYHCPNERCTNHASGWSNKAWIADGRPNYCPAAMCGALIVKRVDSAPAPKEARDSARAHSAPSGASRGQLGGRSTKTSSSPPRSSTPHSDYSNICPSKADVVCRFDPPGIEFVFPSLVQEGGAAKRPPTKPSGLVVLERRAAYAAAHAVPPLGPIRIRRKVRVAVKARTFTPPEGAVYFDGKNYRDDSGRIVLTEEDKQAIHKAKKAAKQAARSARRQKACAKIRKARALQLFRAYSQCTLVEGPGPFQTVMPTLSGLTMGTRSRVVPSVQRKLRKQIKKRTSPVRVEQDFSCLDNLSPDEVRGDLVFDDEDCVAVPKRTARDYAVPNLASPLSFEDVEELEVRAFYSSDLISAIVALWAIPDSALVACELARLLNVRQTLEEGAFDMGEKIKELLDEGTLDDIRASIPFLRVEVQEVEDITFTARGRISDFLRSAKDCIVDKFTSTAAELWVIKEKAGVKIAQWKDGAIDLIIDMMKRIFSNTLGGYMERIANSVSVLKSIWDSIRDWAHRLLETTSLALQALGKYSMFAFLTTLAGAVVLLAEKVLVTIGVTLEVGSLLNLFLFTLIGAIGFSAVGMTTNQLCEMQSAIRLSVINMIRPESSDFTVPGEVENMTARADVGIDRVLMSMKTLGNSLVGAKFGALQYAAKVGQCFDQVARGKRAIGELGAWIVETLGSIYDTVTGSKNTFFNDLSTLVAVDAKKWLQLSSRYQMEACTTSLSDRHTLEMVEKLLEDGRKLQLGLAGGNPRRKSHEYLSLINREVDALSKLVQQAAHAGPSDPTRTYPFWVYLEGASQCGKTNFVNTLLIPQLLEELNCAVSSVYSRNPNDAYMSGYRRQACVKIDDLYAVVTQPSAESLMIGLVNSEPLRLNMSDNNEKGMFFDSPLIVTTCNELTLPTDANVRDSPSFYNRRAVVVRCRRKEGAYYDPDNPLSATECQLVNPKVATGSAPTRPTMVSSNTTWEDDLNDVILANFKLEDPRPQIPHIDVHKINDNETRCHLKCNTGCMGHMVMMKSTTEDKTLLFDKLLKQACWNVTAFHQPLTDWESPEDVLSHIKTYLAAHMSKEQRRMEAVRRNTGNEGPITGGARSFLKDQTVIGYPASDDEKARYHITDKDKFVYMAVDGHLYGYDVLRRMQPVTNTATRNWLDLVEARTLECLPHNIQEYLANGPKNVMVGSFLEDMIHDGQRVDSVDKLGGDSSSHYKEFFASLDLNERVFLRLAQKRNDAICENKGLADHLDGFQMRMLSALLKGYEQVEKHGMSILLFVAGLVCVSIALYGFYHAASALCGAASFAGGLAAVTVMDTKAVFPSGSDAEPYRGKHIPSRHRYITTFTARGGNTEHPWDDMMVTLSVGCTNIYISAIRYRGRSLCLTRHQALAIPEGAEVRCQYNDKPVYVTWHRSDIVEFEDSELVVYINNGLLPTSEKDADLLFCWKDDENALPNSALYEHCVFRFDDGQEKRKIWTRQGELVKTKMVVTGSNYKREIPTWIRTNYLGIENDCGAIAVTTIRGKKRIVGLFIASRTIKPDVDGVSSVCPLPSLNIATARGSIYDYVEQEDGRNEMGFAKIGFLPNEFRPKVVAKTQFQKVPEEFVMQGVETKEPAILSGSDERLKGKPYDPLKNGMDKFSDPMLDLDAVEDFEGEEGSVKKSVLDIIADEMIEEYFDATDCLENVDLDTALNGSFGDDGEYMDPIVTSTSEGYPYVLHRGRNEDGTAQKGKARFLSGFPGEYTLKPDTEVSRDFEELVKCMEADQDPRLTPVPEVVCIECPKDERLPKRKIDNPKTRLFSVLPMPYNIMLRMYYLKFSQHLMQQRHRLPCQVGINPYSREWTELHARLCETNSEVYNCDYKAFDGLITQQCLKIIARIINAGYKKDSQKKKQIRENLLLAISGRYSICGSQVYQVFAGIPSGCALTVLINSMLNEILIRYCYRVLVPKIYRSSFSRYVTLVTYGDDNLMAVSPAVESTFYGEAVRLEMAKYRITITDGTDKDAKGLYKKPIHQADFLKRGFRRVMGGHMVAPLDKLAIYSSLHYVKPLNGNDVIEALKVNVVAALREIVLHPGRQDYDNIVTHYKTVAPLWKLPSYQACLDFHEEQRTGVSPYNAQRFSDIMIDSTQAGLYYHTKPDTKIPVMRRISIAAAKYRATDDECIVSLTGRLVGEGVEVLESKPEMGSGNLPTLKWIKQWRTLNNLTFSRAAAAYDAGREIVFRDHSPFINAWCAAIAFCVYRPKPICDIHTMRLVYQNVAGSSKQSAESAIFSMFGGFDRTKPYGDCVPNKPMDVDDVSLFDALQKQQINCVLVEDFETQHGPYYSTLKRNERIEGMDYCTISLKCGNYCDGHEIVSRAGLTAKSSALTRACQDIAQQWCYKKKAPFYQSS